MPTDGAIPSRTSSQAFPDRARKGVANYWKKLPSARCKMDVNRKSTVCGAPPRTKFSEQQKKGRSSDPAFRPLEKQWTRRPTAIVKDYHWVCQ